MNIRTHDSINDTSEKNLILKLRELAGETDSAAAHPDKGIQVFDSTMAQFIEENEDFCELLKLILNDRKIKLNHFASLLPRAAQFALRKRNIDDYAEFNRDKWKETLSTLVKDPAFIASLYNRQYATNRPYQRYKALAALSSALTNTPIRVYDLGCSLNTGLSGLLLEDFYSKTKDSFEDLTPNESIKTLLKKNNFEIHQAIGVDLQDLSIEEGIEWVIACEYFGNYDRTKEALLRHNSLLSQNDDRLLTLTRDITDSSLPRLLKNAANNNSQRRIRTIVHASMVFYQLTEAGQLAVVENINQVLQAGDIFLELRFIDESDYYREYNMESVVKFKTSEGLSRDYQWLLWNSIYGERSKSGADYDIVMEKLCELAQ